ncbi:ribonuclease III domain-containing protein [Phyllosticta capitalensis]|uniref:Large ribosomal subunit protein mL44 n=1 Tax=Phyllosticta capitalensis TaxID=121624 RepID=A0ABR1YA99_9PEZI
MLTNLLGPAAACQLKCPTPCALSARANVRGTDFRLGKKRPWAGILSRYSRLALAVNRTAAMPTSTEPMTAVLAFQFLGCPYQPPAGDQTCLGYLCRRCQRIGPHRDELGGSHPHAVPQFRQIPLARLQSTISAPQESSEGSTETPASTRPPIDPEDYPSPPWKAARKSAKLAALHARLAIDDRVPLESMARTLVDPSADPHPDFNNAAFATLGEDLMGYYVSEHIICRYPRLPLAVLMSAQEAYVGPDALRAITAEWGVESAAAPGGEVDPGYLQFKRLDPGTELLDYYVGTNRPNEKKGQGWRRSHTSKIVYDDQFGGLRGRRMVAKNAGSATGVAHDAACSRFVRAVVGAVYVHAGREAARNFVHSHFLSRHLDIASLFDFRTPTRDLSKLCAREGFESPVARLLAETGRGSRTPVFVVGVFSGPDKLGEDAGASLDEAKIRATAAALKSWYLYSPVEYTKPSDVEDTREGKKWLPNHIDAGEIVV